MMEQLLHLKSRINNMKKNLFEINEQEKREILANILKIWIADLEIFAEKMWEELLFLDELENEIIRFTCFLTRKKCTKNQNIIISRIQSPHKWQNQRIIVIHSIFNSQMFLRKSCRKKYLKKNCKID